MGDLYTKPQAKAGSIRRGLSPNIFSQAPITEVNNGGLSEGFGLIDDFLSFNDESPWISTAATAGTAILADAKGGVLELDCASGTSGQGIQIQYGGATGAASFVASADSKIYFEARIKVTDISTGIMEVFVGLSEVDTTIIDSGANSSANHIGFELVDDNLEIDFHSESGGSRSSSANVASIADGTYVKLGFLVEGVSKVTPYVNGIAKTAISTNIPTAALTPSLVCQSGGSSVDPIMSVDWVACYQAEQIAN